MISDPLYQPPITQEDIDGPWQNRSNCLDQDPDIFFSEDRHYTKAKDLCAGCSVVQECLEFAMEKEKGQYKRFGFFGGMTPRQRINLSSIKKWNQGENDDQSQ